MLAAERCNSPCAPGKTIQAIGFIAALLSKTGGPEDAYLPELPVSGRVGWPLLLPAQPSHAECCGWCGIGLRLADISMSADFPFPTNCCNSIAMQRLDPLEAPLEESYELLAEEWWAASLQLRVIWPFWCAHVTQQQQGQK